MSKRQAAIKARETGLIKFEYHIPCKKCGGMLFTTSDGGGCHHCKVQKAYAYRKENPEKDRAARLATSLKWAKENPGKALAKVRKREKHIKLRTPAWADLEAIKAFYVNCPAGYHVDHIIPLQGRRVSGLHVQDNLQYLAAIDNLVKGNKFDISL